MVVFLKKNYRTQEKEKTGNSWIKVLEIHYNLGGCVCLVVVFLWCVIRCVCKSYFAVGGGLQVGSYPCNREESVQSIARRLFLMFRL